MTLTLCNLVHRVGRAIGGGVMVQGTATGGSSVTIVDTNDRTEVIDYWNGGTAIIYYDAGGAGAAPENEFSVISDFDATSDTITLRTTLTANAGAGDKYALIKKRYPLQIITQEINNALQKIGPIPNWNSTGITIAASQTEYSLPTVAANMDLREVWYQQDTTDANDNRWRRIPKNGYTIQKSATGTADVIRFANQYETDHVMGIVYLAPHTEMKLYTDKLDDIIYPDRVVYEAAAGCLRWYMDKTKTDDYNAQLARLENQAAQARAMHPIPIPQKTGRIMSSHHPLILEAEPNTVYLVD